MKNQKSLTADENKEILAILKERFTNHMNRHLDVSWPEVEARLLNNPEKLWSLQQMEQSGGEPDVVDVDKETKAFLFMDCSAESPQGRRSLCYDRKALEARKENKPVNSALDLAEEMGIDLLTEAEYRYLQTVGSFDLKTSSWLKTPDDIRKLGGAIFGDCRYKTVFMYHNGADSYYASRGFRSVLRV